MTGSSGQDTPAKTPVQQHGSQAQGFSHGGAGPKSPKNGRFRSRMPKWSRSTGSAGRRIKCNPLPTTVFVSFPATASAHPERYCFLLFPRFFLRLKYPSAPGQSPPSEGLPLPSDRPRIPRRDHRRMLQPDALRTTRLFIRESLPKSITQAYDHGSERSINDHRSPIRNIFAPRPNTHPSASVSKGQKFYSRLFNLGYCTTTE